MVRAYSLVGTLMLVVWLVITCMPIGRVEAAATLIQTANSQAVGTNTNTATFGATATTGRLLVAVCGARDSVTITGPTGFTSAINQSGTPSQGIFYKVSVGTETAVSCGFSANTNSGVHIYEYSGVVTSSPLHGTPGSSTGSSAAPATGSITTSIAQTLLIGAVTTNANTAFSAWSNTFTERSDFPNTQGNPGTRSTFGGANLGATSTGTYSTTATAGASGAWRGQIVAFELIIGSLGVDIVNGSGTPVASPAVGMSARTIGFDCTTSTGTLGSSTERIRITNTTTTPQWTVAIAATSGATATWTSGGNTFDFNDGSGAPAGCADGADADTRPGRMTLDPSVGTTTPQSGCNNTGVTRGASASFAQGVTDSITLINASASADTNCYWELTGVSVSQTIPVQQAAGTYTINLTLTVTAS